MANSAQLWLRTMRLCNMYPLAVLKAIVSSPKHVFWDSNDVLDLSYITPRLIVAAGPSDEPIASVYRTPLSKLISHLDRYSTGTEKHWHIWNLRGEGRGYSLGQGYEGCCTDYPFPDHQPPPITLLCRLISEIHEHLKKDARNVALIHCKEGKGRSGTVCCAYLMYEAKVSGVFLDAEDAIAQFTRRRMRRFFGSGVSIISQVKYLGYWDRYLRLDDVMVTDFLDFHNGGDAERRFQCKIQRIRIIKPSLWLILSDLKLSTYRDIDGSAKPVVFTLNHLRIPIINASHLFYDIELDGSVDPCTKDIKVSFEKQTCLIYTWYNLYFETLGGLKHALCDTSEPVLRKLIIPWQDFDGFAGCPLPHSVRLLESIEIYWSLMVE